MKTEASNCRQKKNKKYNSGQSRSIYAVFGFHSGLYFTTVTLARSHLSKLLRAGHQTGGRRSAQRDKSQRAQVICTRSIFYAYVYSETNNYQAQVAWRALCYMKRTAVVTQIRYPTEFRKYPIGVCGTPGKKCRAEKLVLKPTNH